jgi:capsular polysaccharide biosynthesis protein/Mrp family chromosome partitioning ATPase
MASSSRADTFELSDYLGVVRRRWRIIVALFIVGIVLGGAYTKLAPTTYSASVLVQDNQLPNNSNATGGRTGGPVNMDNEAQVAQSLVVALAAAQALHSPLTPQNLLKQISVAVPPNTTFIQITCAAPTSRAAATCANAFGNAYLSNRRSNIASGLNNQLSASTARISALIRTIADLKSQLSSLPRNSPSRVTVQLKLNQAQAGLNTQEVVANTLTPEIDDLNVPKNTQVGLIATPATPPLAPTSPRALLLVPSGALAGLLIGLLVAAFTDRRDRRIRSARDVERYLDTPVLVDVAFAKSHHSPGVVSSRSRAGQAFTELGQYMAASLGEGNHVLLVAGASTGPGCSLTAANLAVTLARTRSEVVLICADSHSTITPQLLGVPGGRGLSDILSRSCTPAEVARRTADFPRLRVITPGANLGEGTSQLQFESTRWMFGELRKEARYIIVEVQSIGEDADAFALAEFADAAILVVETTLTSRPAATACLQRLDRLRTAVYGAVVLAVPSGRKSARPARGPAEAPLPSRSAPATARPEDVVVTASDRPAPPRSPASPSGRRPDGAVAPAEKNSDSALPPRAVSETRPLPRIRRSDPAERSPRTDYGNPADKFAGR